MWIDSHAHIDRFVQAGEWPALRQNMVAAEVTDVVAIGGTAEANRIACDQARQDPSIHPVVGYDRDLAGQPYDEAALATLAADPLVVGIGETGLDYHYSRDTAPAQQALFSHMLAQSVQVQKPVVVHTREADADTLDHLRTFARQWTGAGAAPGVVHCFTGTREFARQVLDVGMMIGFSGIITFKKSDDLRDVLRYVPLDRLLIETDAPYLAPVPKRGKTNEPAYVRYVGECVADVLGQSPQSIAAITSENARNLFGWSS